MKIRLDEKEGLAADTAIEIDGKESRTPSSVKPSAFGMANDIRPLS